MATYQGLLQRRIELYLNGAWVDFSSRLLTQTLSPNPGRTSGANQSTPSTISFDLDNPTGDLTPFNPVSAYYPYVDVGMLIRYSVYWSGVWYVRGVFEATEVNPYWPYGDLSDGTTTGKPGESYVAISGADILQRLSDDEQPLRSPLYRSITGDSPTAYWPLEDLSGATRAASGVVGVGDGTIGAATFGASLVPAGSVSAIDISAGGALTASTGITAGPVTSWEMQCVVGWDTLPTPFGTGFGPIVMACSTPGSAQVEWGIQLREGFSSDFYLGYYHTNGLGTGGGMSDLGFDRIVAGQTYHFRVVLTQIGADIDVAIYRDGVEAPSSSDTVAATTLYAPTRVTPPNYFSVGTKPSSLSHVAVWSPARSSDSTYAAADGYVGETAGRRLERLAGERGISFTSSGDLDDTASMGVQSTDTFIAVVRECESADLGMLHAQRTANGLHYRTRVDLYNQTPALTLDAAQNELANPFRPSATVTHIVNDVTVNRPDGSSAQSTSQESIDRIGLRPRSYDANVETDDQLADVAGWLLNLGTPDGMRYPSVSSELTLATQLIPDWLALSLGDRIQVVNLPPQHPTDTVDLLVDGYTEPHSPSRWTPQINCSPAAPWDVAELDDDSARLDTDGAYLTTSATSTGTTFQVATATGTSPLWTTSGGQVPYDLLVTGERVTATAVAAPTTITYGAVGTATHASNASVTPGIPASVAAGNLLIVVAAIRNSGTGVPDTPSGYSRLPVFAATDNVQVFAKVAVGGDVAPTITFTGGVANATTSAQMIRIVGAFSDPDDCFVAGQSQLNSSAQNIDYPALLLTWPAPEVANCFVVYLGWKQDDYTSVATISGATEISEASSTTGDDQSLIWDYVIQTTATNVKEGTFTVTGGASAISRGAVFAVRSNVQAITVTRSVNSVVKAQAANTAVVEYRPALLAL